RRTSSGFREAHVHNRFYLAAATCLFAFAINVCTTDGMSPDGVQAAQAPSAQKPTPDPQAGYVGSDTCEACHTEGESLKGTPHAMAMNPRTPAATLGCERCHAPGPAH